MTSIRVAAVLVTAGLLATACGAERDGSADSVRAEASLSAAAATATATATASAIVPAALKFTARTLDGREFEGESLAGKPVVFWFWAPWCPKCRSEAPAVRAAAERFGDVVFVGVASLDTEAAMKEFV